VIVLKRIAFQSLGFVGGLGEFPPVALPTWMNPNSLLFGHTLEQALMCRFICILGGQRRSLGLHTVIPELEAPVLEAWTC